MQLTLTLLVTLLVTLTAGLITRRPPMCAELLTQPSSTAGLKMWNSTIVIEVTAFSTGYSATLVFSSPIKLAIFRAPQLIEVSPVIGSTSVALFNPDTTLRAGTPLNLNFYVVYEGAATVDLERVELNGRVVCDKVLVPVLTTAVPMASLSSRFGAGVDDFNPHLSSGLHKDGRELRYDYAQVLNMSLLFFEAQRSGLLPEDNRVPWRGDSCVNDRGAAGEDLTGGYYTNSRAVKFTFPNAAALTVMAWGVIAHEEAFQSAGQLELARDAIHWGATYLIKCHPSPDMLYALVGDVNGEYGKFWVRPEDIIDFPRPVFAISPSKPGSDLAAEVAAALAASSVALKKHYVRDASLSCLIHARQLYEFALTYRGEYVKVVPDVKAIYESWSGDEDELVWAALWLFRATSEVRYLDEAQTMYRSFKLAERSVQEFSWDEKTVGVRILLYQMTLDPTYKEDAKRFCEMAADANSRTRTPLGLFHQGKDIALLRDASNAAMVCLELGEALVLKGASTNPYLEFAMKQIHYALGDTGRSFMVGFGENWPKFVHHTGSSCKDRPASCGWSDFRSPLANPHVLYGALVGGPDSEDRYDDLRPNWRQNHVALDYNAGFQSTVAALLELHLEGRLLNDAYLTEW